MVLHVTTTDMSLELLLGPQLSAFLNAGYDVIGASATGPYVEALAQRGIQHLPLQHATRAMRPHKDLLALLELYRLFRRLRPEIVHTHNPKPGLYGRIAARAAQVPVVVNTVHGLYAQASDPLPRRAFLYGLERFAATCSDAELLQNPEDAEVLRRLRLPQHRLHALGNGVDLARFDPTRFTADDVAAVRHETFGAATGDVVVGLVGRLVEEKGYLDVFEAAREIATKRPHVRFVVAGPDEVDKADALPPAVLERAANEAGVRFLGMRNDVDRLYAAMDAYVLASHREGFPRSAMEAAAMGLPIVATDIRGCRQVVDGHATGYLVPPGSSDLLADAIMRLVDDEEQRTEFGAAARAKAEMEFDDQYQVKLTLDVYAHMLDARGLSHPARSPSGSASAKPPTAADRDAF